MIGLGLTPAAHRAFADALTRAYQLRVGLQLMTHTHEHRGALPELSAGQVDFDAGGDTVDRSATVTMFDPDRVSGLDKEDPDSFVAYPALMVRITYSVLPAVDGADWVNVPVFTGPIVKVDRNGPEVTIELQGKESLLRRAIHGSKTWPKGTLKTTVISDLLKMGGEHQDYMQLASSSEKLTSSLSIPVGGDVWALANTVANELKMDLGYDGRGVAVLEERVAAPVWTIGKDNGFLLSEPDLTSDTITGLVNQVKVTGATTKGTEVAGVATAPSTHPLSPAALARNGVGLAWIREESDDTATTTTKAKAKAQALLDEELYLDDTTSALSCLPIPHLELGDTVQIQTDRWVKTHKVRQMTLPLVHSETMTVGGLAHVSRK